MSLQDESSAFRSKAQEMLGEKFGVLTQGIEALRTSGMAEQTPQVGQQAPEFSLVNAQDGQQISLSKLLQKGPVVLSFYRGEWCPFCNLELKAFQQTLPQIQALGASFVAVSPEKPEFGQSMAEKDELTFPVLTDSGNKVARQYNLVFEVDPEVQAMSRSVFKNDISTRNADGTWELPIPGTFVIDQQRTIRFAHADPDYMTGRAEPEAVLSVLHTMAH